MFDISPNNLQDGTYTIKVKDMAADYTPHCEDDAGTNTVDEEVTFLVDYYELGQPYRDFGYTE